MVNIELYVMNNAELLNLHYRMFEFVHCNLNLVIEFAGVPVGLMNAALKQ